MLLCTVGGACAVGELLTAMIWPQMLQSECRQQHPGAGQANGTDTHPGDVARNCDARPTQCSIVHPRAACLISTGFLSCSHHVRVAPAAAGSGGCGNRRRRLVLGAGCGVDAMPCLEGRRAAMLECISLHAAACKLWTTIATCTQQLVGSTISIMQVLGITGHHQSTRELAAKGYYSI